jgi:hypothetical protein
VGGPVLGVPGVAGTAVSIDGFDDHVRVPDSSSLDVGDSFTLEGWILRDADGETHQLFNKGGRGFHLVVMDRFNGNQVWLRKAGSATLVRTAGGVPADGRFHHVVAVKDGSQVAIYIDGVAQELQVAQMKAIENTAFPLFFSATRNGDVVAGDLDEFAVYDRALTAGEVQGRFGRGEQEPPVSVRTRSAGGGDPVLPGGLPAGAGRCTDIGSLVSGIAGIRVVGVDCAAAKRLTLGGPQALQAAGFECRIRAESFAGRLVRITRTCVAAGGAKVHYVTRS